MLKLKEIRNQMKMTIEELSEKSGVSMRMISAYEARTSDITYIKMQQLADALGVSILELTTEYVKTTTEPKVIRDTPAIEKDSNNENPFQEEIITLYKKQIQLLEEHSKVLLQGQDDLRDIISKLRDTKQLLEEKVMDLTAKLMYYEASASDEARSA